MVLNIKLKYMKYKKYINYIKSTIFIMYFIFLIVKNRIYTINDFSYDDLYL